MYVDYIACIMCMDISALVFHPIIAFHWCIGVIDFRLLPAILCICVCDMFSRSALCSACWLGYHKCSGTSLVGTLKYRTLFAVSNAMFAYNLTPEIRTLH